MACHFIHLLQVLKKCLWSLILYNFFHNLMHVYSPGARTDSPQGTKKPYHFTHLLQVSKKSLRGLILYVFFMNLYIYIAPRHEQTAPRGQSFDIDRNVLSCHSFVSSFKKMSLKSDFIQFFHDLIHVYSLGAGADSPQGIKRPYHFTHLLQVPKKSNFIQFFCVI